MNLIFQIALSTLRVSTPLLFVAMGGLLSERSGVINIALEGLMLAGAFGSACVALATGSPEWAALAGMGAGMLIAALYGFSVISLRSNQIVAGTAINILSAGVTPFLCKILYDSAGSSPAIPIQARFQWAPLFLVWFIVFAVAWMLRSTELGLWIRFAGENPQALDSSGIRVNRIRWIAVLLSGALAGLGGACLSIDLSSSFSRNMTAGRGYIALAALIFGKWRPIPAALACLLFGFADAMQIRLQGVVLWGVNPVPVQFIQIFPYLLTILLLAGFVGKSRAPKALGLPFVKG